MEGRWRFVLWETPPRVVHHFGGSRFRWQPFFVSSEPGHKPRVWGCPQDRPSSRPDTWVAARASSLCFSVLLGPSASILKYVFYYK